MTRLSCWNTITAVWTRATNELHGNSIKDFMWLLPHLAAWSRRRWDHLRTESLLNTKQMKDWLFISALGRATASTLNNCKPLGPNKQVITAGTLRKTVHYSLPVDDIRGLSLKLAKLSCEKFYPLSGKFERIHAPRRSCALITEAVHSQCRQASVHRSESIHYRKKRLIPASKILLWVAKKRKNTSDPMSVFPLSVSCRLESGRASVWSLFSGNCRWL